MRTLALMVVVLPVFAAGCAANRAPAAAARPDPVQLRKELAQSLIAHGDWLAATEPLLELAALTPNDADVHGMLGDVYREQGLYDAAERAYGRALELAPENARALGGLGVMRDLRGDPGDGALEPLRKAVKVQPLNPTHQNNLGFALYIRGRYEEAAAAFQEALRMEPGSSQIRNNLGFTWGRLGDLDRARREFERANRAAGALNNVGLVHELAGDFGAACRSYRDALSRDATLNVAWVNAERACARAATPFSNLRSTP